mgnify:CR=1 FL=1
MQAKCIKLDPGDTANAPLLNLCYKHMYQYLIVAKNKSGEYLERLHQEVKSLQG